MQPLTLVPRSFSPSGAPAFAEPERRGPGLRALRGILYISCPLRGAIDVSPGVPAPRLAWRAHTAAPQTIRLGPQLALSLRPLFRDASLFRSRLLGPCRGPPCGASFVHLAPPY